MDSFLIAIFAIFGLMIGSFLNVLVLRYNTGKGFGGRSECFSCGKTLHKRDLFPLFSYIFSRGRCRMCGSKISVQYILVEAVTAALFVAVYIHNAYLIQGKTFVSNLVFTGSIIIDCLIISLLVSMSAYDIRHKIIPDKAVFLFAGLGLLSQLVLGTLSWHVFLAGILLALPFYLIWVLSSGMWMGLGDAKLALGIGWMLGLWSGLTAIIFGFWIGAIISLLIIFIQKTMQFDGIRKVLRKMHIPMLSMRSEVPFAPFLIAGLLIVYILRYNLFTFLLIG